MKKKKWLIVLGILFIISCIFYQPIMYMVQLGKGQLSILLNTQPINEILDSSAEPDSIKAKLRIIREIYSFGTTQLGLTDNGAYQNYYDQKGKPVLWVLTVCKPYSLDPETWTFPIAGTVSYKGFFNKEAGLGEMDKWQSKGYDVSLEEVFAWSTLGWFNDPVLSEMLQKHPGDIANTILHEMTHATIYKSGDIEFNENIASFIGDKGAEAFLIAKYGKDSEWLNSYRKSVQRRKIYSELVLNQATKLDRLYKSCLVDSEAEKVLKKKRFMEQAVLQLNKFRKTPMQTGDLNNCYYADVNRYRNKQIAFDSILVNKCSGQLKQLIDFYAK